jgi:hypothetical protein
MHRLLKRAQIRSGSLPKNVSLAPSLDPMGRRRQDRQVLARLGQSTAGSTREWTPAGGFTKPGLSERAMDCW